MHGSLKRKHAPQNSHNKDILINWEQQTGSFKARKSFRNTEGYSSILDHITPSMCFVRCNKSVLCSMTVNIMQKKHISQTHKEALPDRELPNTGLKIAQVHDKSGAKILGGGWQSFIHSANVLCALPEEKIIIWFLKATTIGQLEKESCFYTL